MITIHSRYRHGSDATQLWWKMRPSQRFVTFITSCDWKMFIFYVPASKSNMNYIVWGETPETIHPLPWASVHWLVQCTLECHWKATGWPSVHWDTTGKTELKQPHTGMPLDKLSWIRPTLGCHWRNSNFWSLHWNTTGGSVTAHTRPDTYSQACRVASTPVWNDKMAGHQ